MTPSDRKYTTSHEWVKLDGATATVGITDHAQDALGDITFVELPKTGAALTAGTECGVIESVKAAGDLYSPVTGVVSDINAALTAEPEAINQSPYESGWLFKATVTDTAHLDTLMDAAAYEKFLENDA